MERLENFEKALKNIINEYENLGKELDKLNYQNTATMYIEVLQVYYLEPN